jgi:hypothetical protein
MVDLSKQSAIPEGVYRAQTPSRQAQYGGASTASISARRSFGLKHEEWKPTKHRWAAPVPEVRTIGGG